MNEYIFRLTIFLYFPDFVELTCTSFLNKNNFMYYFIKTGMKFFRHKKKSSVPTMFQVLL